jgi:hypothetical protein
MFLPSSPDGNATVQYFEGSTFIGTREVYCCGYAKSDGTRTSAFWPHTAYFCPHCGEVWARAIYDHHFDYQPIPQASWVVETRRCPIHGDGLLLTGYLSDLTQCSRELLAREALLLCITNPPFKDPL